ncbi:hypothetical protein [Streptomyces mordarskii]|uniref:Uncharacterized protein n=1 Tax=Streptomyces mordarskii TaxID=1226758 RepID=A0ABN1EUL9_9ACTN
MFEKRHARREARARHRQLMNAALDLVGMFGDHSATSADLIALVFGQHAIEIGEDEAARYLDAARVTRGQRLPAANELEDQDEPAEEPRPID